MKKRDDYIDIIKAIGILLVIYNHSDPTFLSGFVSRFHIPVFFVISGIMMGLKSDVISNGNKLLYVKKKAISLLLPYFLWGIIDLIVYLSVSPQIYTNKQFIYYFLGMRNTEEYYFTGALWFLTALFACQIFLVLFIWTYKFKAVKWISIVVVSIIIVIANVRKCVLPLNLDTVLYTFPFMAGGYLIGKNGVYDKYRNTNFNIILFILGCVAVRIITHIDGGVNVFAREYSNYIMFVFGGFFGSLVVFETAKVFVFIQSIANIFLKLLVDYVSFVGKESLAFMAIHQQIIIHPLNCYNIILENAHYNFIFRFCICIVLSTILVLVKRCLRALAGVIRDS